MTYQEIPNYVSELNNALICFPVFRSRKSQYPIQKKLFDCYPEFKEKTKK